MAKELESRPTPAPVSEAMSNDPDPDLCDEFTNITLLLRLLTLLKQDYHAPNFELVRTPIPEEHPVSFHPLEAAASILAMDNEVIAACCGSQQALSKIIVAKASRTDGDVSLEDSFENAFVHSSIEDAHSSVEDAHFSFEDAHFSFEDAHFSFEDIQSSAGDAHSSAGDTRSSVGDTYSSADSSVNTSIEDVRSRFEDAHIAVKDPSARTPTCFAAVLNPNDRSEKIQPNLVLKVVDVAEAVDYWPDVQKNELHCLSV